MQTRQQLNVLRQDIQAAHVSLGTISQELAQQTDSSWQDASECYRIAPRLFGEDYKYACEVRYSTELSDVPVEHVRQLTKETIVKEHGVNFGEPQTDLTGVFTSFLATIKVNQDNSAVKDCLLEYVSEHSSSQMTGRLECYYSLTKAEFDAISSVLPLGDDRT